MLVMQIKDSRVAAAFVEEIIAYSAKILEAVTDTYSGDDRVDLDLADILAVQLDLGLDVDITDVGIHKPAVCQLHINSELRGQAPGILQLQVAQGTLGAEERGVVHANADIGLDLGVGQEVPLQAERGRQLLGGTDVAQALCLDVMLEWKGAKQFDAYVARGHVGQADAWARAGTHIDADGIIDDLAVVGLRGHVGDARLDQPVAAFVGACRRGKHGTRGNQTPDNCFVYLNLHHFSILLVGVFPLWIVKHAGQEKIDTNQCGWAI